MSGMRRLLNILLFEVRTVPGRFFNISMLLLIMGAVVVSMLDTVPGLHHAWGKGIESFQYWVLVAFAIEYVLRVYAARHRWTYIKGFNGIVDLITVLPLLLMGNSYVLIRLLRLTRVIRVAVSIPVVRALFTSLGGAMQLLAGVLGSIILISVLTGNIIFILEPGTFANAFEGTWWSLVTMSTVGYGDFVPQTPVGKSIAAALIMAGICMFAMVTAVISVRVGRMVNNAVRCGACGEAISQDFPYCPHCAAFQRRETTLPLDLEDDI